MPRRLLSAEQFANACPDPGAPKPEGLVYRLATVDPAEADRQTGRVIPYIFSTPAVARDGHTINQNGWVLTNFRTNPVCLWCHDSLSPPIGKVNECSIANGALRGSIEYADADTFPFADTIFRLVKGGFLRSVSVSWDPIKWTYSTDRSRPGGIDFLEQELREVSQVPVPADVGAIATARSRGIDTGPLYAWAEKILDTGETIVIPRAELEALRREAKMPSLTRAESRADSEWKVGAARGLPVNTTLTWDGAAAEKRIFDDAGFGGDSPDPAKARKAFLFYDASAPEKKGSYKCPFADLVDGKLTAIKAGLDAAASRLDATDVPQAAKDDAKAVLDSYKPADADRTYKPAPRSAMPFSAFSRDLTDVSWLSSVVADMAFCQWCMQMEAEWEGDDSPLPDRLAEIIKAAGQLLIDSMTEEVGELIAQLEVGEGGMRAAPEDALTGAQAIKRAVMVMVARAAMPAAAKLRTGRVEGMDAKTVAQMLRADMLTPAGRNAAADLILSRAGKAISATNEASLRTAHDHMRAAADCIRGVVASNNVDTAPDPLAPLDTPLVTQMPNPEDDATRATRRQDRERLARQAVARAAVAAAAE